MTKNATDRRYSRIASGRLLNSAAIGEMRVHGPELVDPKPAVSIAVATLAEEHRTGRRQLYGDRNRNEGGREKQNSEPGPDDVEEPFSL